MLQSFTLVRPDGRRLRYSDNQREHVSVLVFLHGWGADRLNLAGIYSSLESEYRILTFDLPGFGESDRPEAVWGSEEYAAEIHSAVSDLGINEYAVTGHSFGGKIAVLMAYRNPSSVKNLVLIAASCLRSHRSLDYYVRVYTFKFMKFCIGTLLRRNDVVECMRNKAGSADYRASAGMRDILSRVVSEDFTSVLSQLSCPSFIYWGEKDTATPVNMAYKIHKLIKESGLYIVRNGSHYPFLEDNRIIQIIRSLIPPR